MVNPRDIAGSAEEEEEEDEKEEEGEEEDDDEEEEEQQQDEEKEEEDQTIQTHTLGLLTGSDNDNTPDGQLVVSV